MATDMYWCHESFSAEMSTDFEVGDGSVSSFQVVANFDNILSIAPTLNTGFIVLELVLNQSS